MSDPASSADREVPKQAPQTTSPKTAVIKARWRPWLGHMLGIVLDCVWPTVLPPTKEEEKQADERQKERRAEQEAAIAALSLSDCAALDVAAARIEKLSDSEDERRKGIETRLASVLALSSVTTVITFGIFSSVFEKELALASEWRGLAVLFLLAYVGLQLVHATGAAVAGLRRRGYSSLEPADLLPEAGELPASATKRIAGLRVECFLDAQKNNNSKVTQMEIAHVSLRNSFAGLTALILLMLATAILGRAGKPLETRVVEKLRADSELLEKLRGAPGEPGPPGLQGERGADGQSCNCPAPLRVGVRERRR